MQAPGLCEATHEPCKSSFILTELNGTQRCISPQRVVDTFNAAQAELENADKKRQLIQSKLDVSESKLEALERLLSNPATQYYCSLNGKMLVTKMRQILKGEQK